MIGSNSFFFFVLSQYPYNNIHRMALIWFRNILNLLNKKMLVIRSCEEVWNSGYLLEAYCDILVEGFIRVVFIQKIWQRWRFWSAEVLEVNEGWKVYVWISMGVRPLPSCTVLFEDYRIVDSSFRWIVDLFL